MRPSSDRGDRIQRRCPVHNPLLVIGWRARGHYPGVVTADQLPRRSSRRTAPGHVLPQLRRRDHCENGPGNPIQAGENAVYCDRRLRCRSSGCPPLAARSSKEKGGGGRGVGRTDPDSGISAAGNAMQVRRSTRFGIRSPLCLPAAGILRARPAHGETIGRNTQCQGRGSHAVDS